MPDKYENQKASLESVKRSGFKWQEGQLKLKERCWVLEFVGNGGDAEAAAAAAGWAHNWLRRAAKDCLACTAVMREVSRYRDFLIETNKSAAEATAVPPVEPEEYTIEWVLLRLKKISERAEKDADQIKALGEIARIKQLSKQSEREIDMKDNSLQITIKGLGGRAVGGLGTVAMPAALASVEKAEGKENRDE